MKIVRSKWIDWKTQESLYGMCMCWFVFSTWALHFPAPLGGAWRWENQGVQCLTVAAGVRVCPDQAECGELSPFHWKSDKRIHCIKHDSQQSQLHVWVDYGTHVSDTDTCIDGSMNVAR